MLEYAIQIHEPGGPEKLCWEEVEVPEPGPGEVLIKQAAVGLNMVDVEYRKGILTPPSYPFVPGLEGAGFVLRTGDGVDSVSVGDRVAFGKAPLGAYSRLCVVPEKFLIRIPEEMSEVQAAGIMYRGLMVHTMLRRTFRLDHTHTILVNGAAGGTGVLTCEWARYLGATVIGTVDHEDKLEFAKENGCAHVFPYTDIDLKEAVMDVTKGKGVHVVCDGVGEATYLASLECLRPLGMMMSFAETSGPAPAVDMTMLRHLPSVFITRPRLSDYKAPLEEYQLAAAEMLELVLKRHLRINIMQTYYLKDAAFAHSEVEAGNTMGSSVFVFE